MCCQYVEAVASCPSRCAFVLSMQMVQGYHGRSASVAAKLLHECSLREVSQELWGPRGHPAWTQLVLLLVVVGWSDA